MRVVRVAAALAALLMTTVAVEALAAGEHAAPLLAARAKKKKKPKRPAKEAAAPAPAAAPLSDHVAPVAPTVDLPPPPALPSSAAKSVALLPLVGIDVDEELLHAMEVALMREIDETPGLRAISPRDVQNDLAGPGLTTLCEDDTLCLARAGRYARAHLALESRIAAIGGTLNVSMRLVDTVKQVELTRVADPVSEEASERAQELHRLAVQLLSPDSYVGALTIKCPTEGAEVYLDDKLVGTTPLSKPITDLRAGPHILRISKPGFSDLYRFVDVVYKRSSTIELDLSTNTIAGLIIEEVSTTGFGSLFIAASEPGIEIRVDGEPKGTTLLEAPIEKVAAGKRRLSLHREGSPAVSQEIEVKVGQRTDIVVAAGSGGLEVNPYAVVSASAALPELTVAVTDSGAQASGELRGTTWKLVAGLALAGAGVAALGVSGYYGNQVKQAEIEADGIVAQAQDPNGPPVDRNQLQAQLDEANAEGRSAQTRHIGTLVGGGIAAAAGAILVLWDLVAATGPADAVPAPAPSVTQTVRLGVQPIDGGATLLLGGRF